MLNRMESLKISPKLFLILSFFLLVVIPFRIHTYNYAPSDDAKRHVAKAVSGRSWPDILVMDPQFEVLDHNLGWHVILGAVHRLGADRDTLLLFSTIGLFLAFSLTGLVLFRNAPWAWILALGLTYSLSSPARLLLGRPYLLSSTIFYVLIHLWNLLTLSDKRKILLTIACIALAGWVHGAWYLFVLIPLGLFLAQKFKEAILSGISWIAGSIVAGLFHGNPWLYLWGQISQSLASVDSAPVTRLLVTEFQPAYNPSILIFLTLGFLAMKHFRGHTGLWTKNPAFWLILVCWILGISNGRFWWDWGNMAFLYLAAVTFQAIGKKLPAVDSGPKLTHAALLFTGLYLLFTADISSRWSNHDFVDPLSLNDPDHVEWMPEPGGILYSDDMLIYYTTFFENPHGEWRYVLGHEPALMPPDLLRIYRQIQFYRHMGDHLYLPWIERMTPADRLVLTRSKRSVPDLPQLEWHYAAFNTWVGRLPAEQPPTPEAAPNSTHVPVDAQP